MVEVSCGGRVAYLRLFGTQIFICSKNGLPIRSKMGDYGNAYFQQALQDLADGWRLCDYAIYHDCEDLDNYESIFGWQRIKYAVQTEGALTPEEEIDWLIVNRGKTVYNIVDGKLWEVDWGNISGKPQHHVFSFDEEWSVPEVPDYFYKKFEKAMLARHEGKTVTQNRVGHYKVTTRLRNFQSVKFPAVAILMDEKLGYHRVTRLTGEMKEVLYPHYHDLVDIREGQAFLCDIASLVRAECFEALFPEEWDVVQLSRKYFYEETFAGLCYCTQNSFGMSYLPKGYVIAWENKYNDVVLLRKRPNFSEIRCPDGYKGKVIGTHGGNIKRIAKELGYEHWQIKLV